MRIKITKVPEQGLFAYGGPVRRMFNDGGYTYGSTTPLNYDKQADVEALHAEGSDYMKKRQFLIDNWNTPEVQDWIKKVYNPYVTKYNINRGYKGNFDVKDLDTFKKGSYDGNVGGMYMAIINNDLPSILNTNTPSTLGTREINLPFMSQDVLYNPSETYNEPTTLTPMQQIAKDKGVTVTDNGTNFSAPVLSGSGNSNDSKSGEDKTNLAPTWMRYAPLFGSIIGLTQGLLSKPDYSNADMILNASSDAGTYKPVSFRPVGDYMRYTPLDRLFYANQRGAQAAATRRSILNTSGGNRGTAMAGLLAADYNAQNSLGNLYRQAEEYNLAQRQKVAEFNRGTNMFNSEGFLKADMANQKAAMEAKQSSLSGIARAAALRQAVDDARSAGISANFSNIFETLGNIGWENFNRNMVNTTKGSKHEISNRGGVSYVGANGGYLTIKNRKRRK